MMYKEAKEMNEQLLAWRRQIHHHPELGCRLPQTTALVKKALDDMGISWEEIGPCAIVGVIGKKRREKDPAPGRHGRPAHGRGDRSALCLGM